MTSRYFLDTTVLAEIALKREKLGKAIRKKLTEPGADSSVPVFAIREMKAGVLGYWVWIHNKLAITKSLAQALEASRRLIQWQRYRPSGALEALVIAITQSSLSKKSVDFVASKNSDARSLDELLSEELRLTIRRRIHQSWERRRSCASRTVVPLSCYVESAPTEKRGQIEIEPIKCDAPNGCCLTSALRSDMASLERLKEANDRLPDSNEVRRRAKSLAILIEKPKQQLSEKECVALGDALFSFFCPSEAVILTTNIRDHGPLAEALGKKAESPINW